MTRILSYPQTLYEGLYHRISRGRRYHRLGFHWHLIVRQVWAGSPTTISIYYRNDLVMTGKPVREGSLPTDVVGHKIGGHICTRITDGHRHEEHPLTYIAMLYTLSK